MTEDIFDLFETIAALTAELETCKGNHDLAKSVIEDLIDENNEFAKRIAALTAERDNAIRSRNVMRIDLERVEKERDRLKAKLKTQKKGGDGG